MTPDLHLEPDGLLAAARAADNLADDLSAIHRSLPGSVRAAADAMAQAEPDAPRLPEWETIGDSVRRAAEELRATAHQLRTTVTATTELDATIAQSFAGQCRAR